MQTELSAASRHEHLALFDPAAIPADTPVDPDLEAQDPQLLPTPAMMDLAGRGRALILHIPTEDCEARLQLLVDEEASERIRSRGTIVLTDAILRVPSGVLRADGLEFLTRPGEARTQSQPTETAVAAGWYSVEVLDLLSWKLRHRNAEGRRGFSQKDLIAHRLVTTYTWLGILFVPANLFVAPLVVAYFWRRGWQSGLTAAAIILAIDAAILGGFWLLQAAQKRFPILSRVASADAEFDRENPDIVIVLRRGGTEAPAGPPAFAAIRITR